MKPILLSTYIPYLEIGDTRKNLSDDEVRRGCQETRRERGELVFKDVSRLAGTRERVLGETIYRVGEEKMEADGFIAHEYFAYNE